MIKRVFIVAAVLCSAYLAGGFVFALTDQEFQARARIRDGNDSIVPMPSFPLTAATDERALLRKIEQNMRAGAQYETVPAREYVSGRYMPWRNSLVMDDSAVLVMQSGDYDYVHLVVRRAPSGDALETCLVWRQAPPRGRPDLDGHLGRVLNEAIKVRTALGQ